MTLPLALTKLSYLIDNPWSVSQARADMAGLILADSIIDRNLDRLRQLDDIFLSKVQTLASSPYAIQEAISHADLVIGAVLVVGAAAPPVRVPTPPSRPTVFGWVGA